MTQPTVGGTIPKAGSPKLRKSGGTKLSTHRQVSSVYPSLCS